MPTCSNSNNTVGLTFDANSVATLSLTKYTNKPYADVGDIITYTVSLVNTGNTPATNVVFLDSIPISTKFINNSFTVNGVTQSGASPLPSAGGIVGTIMNGGAATVTFNVCIITIPTTNLIENFAEANFNYTQDINNLNALSGHSESNMVSTRIRHGDITLKKCSNTTGAKIGDIVNYTITITNIGNISIQNLIFTDDLAPSFSFVENSAKINGTVQQGVTPLSSTGGMNIANINAGEVLTISFDALVVSAPDNNIVDNKAKAIFYYKINLDGQEETLVERESNSAEVSINQAIIDSSYPGSFVKTVDKEYADVDEILTYTLVLQNVGNVDSTNVVVIDTIPKGTVFVPNSVKLNGILQNRANPSPGLGINIGTLAAGEYATVNFKVQVVTVPSTNTVVNDAIVSFRFTSIQNCQNKIIGNGISNSVVTEIRNGALKVLKSADKTCANLGDIITYIIAISNKGNVIVDNIEVKDMIPGYTSFIPNSLVASCKEVNGIFIEKGLVIPCLEPNKTVVLIFKVKVESAPSDGEINNTAQINYEFFKDDIGTIVKKEITSNKVTVIVNNVNFEGDNFIQKVNSKYTTLGDSIEYNFEILNSGNVRATDVTFIDTLPESLTLIPNSFNLNGVTIEGVDIQSGVPIGTVQPGEKIDLKFSAKVNSIPNTGFIGNLATLEYRYTMDPCKQLSSGVQKSNQIDIRIKSPNIIIEKSVEPLGVKVGGEATYIIKIRNLGNTIASDIILRDILGPLLEFEEDSLTLDDKEISGNIINGINISSIEPNHYRVIKFKVKVLGYTNSKNISNYCMAIYKFIVDPNKIPRKAEAISNICDLDVGIVNLTVTKETDTYEAIIGSKINFSILIQNTGTVKVNEVIFKDILPKYLEFDSKSFMLNNISIKSVNLKSGVRVGSLKAGEKVNIRYSSIVVGTPCNGRAENAAYAEFNYKINEESPIENQITKYANTDIRIPSSTFKQIAVNQNIFVGDREPQIDEIDSVKVDVNILNHYISKNCSDYEANAGDKLIINGFIINQIEYTSAVRNNGVYNLEYKKPFTTYVLLPKNHDRLRNLDIRALVEDVSHTIVDRDNVLVNVVFMIDVRLL